MTSILGDGGGTDAPWVGLYAPGTPVEMPAEVADMLSVFRACARNRPDHPAMIYFDGVMTYAELDAYSDALACWLISMGLGRGDRVAVIMQNMPQFLIMTVAAWKVGAIPVPGNPMYRKVELARIFEDSQPSAILCLHDHLDEVRGALNEIGLPNLPLLSTSGYEYQTRDDPRVLPTAQRPVAGDASLSFVDVVAAYRGRSPPPLDLAGDEIGLLLYTSGTTGAPKGAMIRHSSLAFNAQALRDWCGIGERSRVLALAPFFHITGFSCHLTVALSARATLIAHYRVEPSLLLDIIREQRPTFTIGAITAFNALMNVPGVAPADMVSFDRIYSGGAPIPPALMTAIEDRLGVKIHSSYGMTETTAPTHLAPFGADIPVDPTSGALSIGVPMPSTAAMIIDDAGGPVAPGTVGQIVTRGPQVMAGYWRKPEETASALRDGWMQSGDVGFMDEAGWFYLVDRMKDVIIASGFKVWPREVEDVLYAHPAVREAAVVGLPDAYRGETVKAFVSLRPHAVVEPHALLDHCRCHLAAYKVPRTIEIIAELPKTITGKIQRLALRA